MTTARRLKPQALRYDETHNVVQSRQDSTRAVPQALHQLTSGLRACQGGRLSGPGLHSIKIVLSWKAPLLFERTSFAQRLISSGCIRTTPQEPNPPAFAIAMDNEGALTPAIGASRMGTRRPKCEQNASARSRTELTAYAPSANSASVSTSRHEVTVGRNNICTLLSEK